MPAQPSWPGLITQLIEGQDLSAAQAAWAMDEVMAGEANPVALGGFLVALRAKGETVDELDGLSRSMLDHAHRIELPGPAVDIVGTGGDRAGTHNISTMAALVAAGTGARVVKHGNRAASSSSGSADLLEALGVRLTMSPGAVSAVYSQVGIAFLFAQMFHPSMRHAATTRSALGVATVFNFLGPMTNPAQPRAAAIGCAKATMAPLMAGVLAKRGISALVFRGDDGLDELAATGRATIWWAAGGELTEHRLDPAADLGLDRITVADLRGGSPSVNAAMARNVLAGGGGAVRQTVELNAAAALVALEAAGDQESQALPDVGADPAGGSPVGATGGGDTGGVVGPGGGATRTTAGLVDRLAAGLDQARAAIDSGAAAKLLGSWVHHSQSAA
ncbi:MAG: anthranilate phosphoribosyltransferase [Micrococcales bacterium]|nr:anthranilate phosphoribosyltransferase [Micrococcales bacterium]